MYLQRGDHDLSIKDISFSNLPITEHAFYNATSGMDSTLVSIETFIKALTKNLSRFGPHRWLTRWLRFVVLYFGVACIVPLRLGINFFGLGGLRFRRITGLGLLLDCLPAFAFGCSKCLGGCLGDFFKGWLYDL